MALTALSSVSQEWMGTTPRKLRLDLLRGRADGVDGLDARAEQIGELGVVGVLVFAAEDEVNAAGECGDGLGGGVDVGGLGVVVEFDAVDGGDVFEAMLDGLEILDGRANRLRRRLRRARERRRRPAHFRRCVRP